MDAYYYPIHLCTRSSVLDLQSPSDFFAKKLFKSCLLVKTMVGYEQVLKPLYLKDMLKGNGRNGRGTKRTRSVYSTATTTRRGPPRSRGPDTHERKFFDSSLLDTGVLTVGSVQPSLIIIAQGTTESERVGRKIRIASVHYRGHVTIPFNGSTGAGGNDIIRMILVQDKQVNGATFLVLDYLETADIHSFRNLSNVNRFHTLYDRQFQVDGHQGGGRGDNTVFTGVGRVPFQFHKNVNIPIEYNNTFTDGRVTTQTSNGLFWLFISQAGLGSVEAQFRIRFTDGA